MMKLYLSSSNFSYNNGEPQSHSEIFNFNDGKGYYKRYKNNRLIENKNFNKNQLKKLLNSKKNNKRINLYNLDKFSARYNEYDLHQEEKRYNKYQLTGGNNLNINYDNLKKIQNNDIEPGLDLNNTSFSKNIIRLTPK